MTALQVLFALIGVCISALLFCAMIFQWQAFATEEKVRFRAMIYTVGLLAMSLSVTTWIVRA